jgi:hypothetical protein
MKYVKENLTLVICGAVAVLLLVFALAPLPYCVPTLKASLVEDMTDRYKMVDTIKGYGREQLSLPGVPPATGIPTKDWVEAKKAMINDINNQQKAVELSARNFNMKGRVEGGVPLLSGNRITGILPTVKGDPMDFKGLYGQQFHAWTVTLSGIDTKDPDESAMPPNYDKLKADWDAKQAALAAQTPAGLGGPAFGGNMSAQATQQFNAEAKSLVMNRASGLRMYVEATAFQKRPWLFLTKSPEDDDVFYAVVDSWFQFDVVKAISAVNQQAKNVGNAPIKRLTRIVVGNNARVHYITTSSTGAAPTGATASPEPGPLFLTSTNAATTAVPGSAVTGPLVANSNAGVASSHTGEVKLPETPNAKDFSLGMTGHAAGATYDVSFMSIVMDMEPSAFFKFEDALYRQNSGYTVVNTQMRTVDPLERASDGYLYGNQQVIEVELTVECILFRSWTEPLMPNRVKLDLGGSTQAPAN